MDASSHNNGGRKFSSYAIGLVFFVLSSARDFRDLHTALNRNYCNLYPNRVSRIKLVRSDGQQSRRLKLSNAIIRSS